MNIKKLTGWYLILYTFIILTFCTIFKASPIGEWDDYSLVTISIINEHNFSITQNDVEKAKEIFPEWKSSLEKYRLSGYVTKAGGEMSWYFPTYSAICVPMVLILLFLKLPAVYSFCLTNIIVFMIMLLLIYYNSKISDKKKLILILMLSINPIVFYFVWISAEVFIFSILSMSMLFWTNKRYKISALLLSIAGTLNPTILLVGIVMIVEYLLKIYIECSSTNLKEKFKFFICRWKEIIQYGCCYIIALLPFIYNYYNTGHINLTASLLRYLVGKEKPISRFIAYLFDLNFGMLPYYNFVFVLAIFLLIMAIIKRKYTYIIMMLGFLGTMYIYSYMVHINCGMAGISRYNAWCAVIMVFAVCIYYDEIIFRKYLKIGINFLFIITIFSNLIILYNYGFMHASNTSYVSMTPIAKYILNKYPSVYNPLPSTFNSRIKHTDGGYKYETPIYYKDSENNARKILASEKDKETLKNTLVGNERDMLWINQKIERLKEEDGYISIPIKYNISIYPLYESNNKIMFSTDKYNANLYTVEELSGNENKFLWTNGNTFKMKFRISNFLEYESIYASFNLYEVYNDKQTVSVFINGQDVFHSVVNNGQNLEFAFEVPSDGLIDLEFQLPDAISPYTLGKSKDTRNLSLAITDAVFIGLNEKVDNVKECIYASQQLTDEIDIYNYLDKLVNPNYITIISGKDDFSGKLDDKILEKLKNLGFKSDLKGKYRWSYLGIVDSNSVKHEELKDGRIDFNKQINDLKIEAVSAGMNSGNISNIKINDKEYSLNHRGLNIVVYDKRIKKVIDSVCFDTHGDLKAYR